MNSVRSGDITTDPKSDLYLVEYPPEHMHECI